MVKTMTRIILYFKLLLLSWYSKGKSLFQTIWDKIRTSFHSPKFIEDTPETSYIYSEKYHSLFKSIGTQDVVIVSEQVWDQIQQSLPQNYIMPNPVIMALFQSMSSDSYDNMFNNPSSIPHLFVDNKLWNDITHVLPQSYILPNPVFDKITKPMSDKYYETIFSKEIKTDKQVFVDNKLWEPIKNSLPKKYSLPNQHSDILFKAMDGNTHHPLMPKENSTTILTDEEIRRKILNDLPKNYKIPNLSFSKYSPNN
jgi:hypothetical protein